MFVETSQEDISATSVKAHYLFVLHTFPVFPGVCFGDVCVCVFVFMWSVLPTERMCCILLR